MQVETKGLIKDLKMYSYPKEQDVIYLDSESQELEKRINNIQQNINHSILEFINNFEDFTETSPSALEFIERAYQLTDQITGTIKNQVVCQKKCAACCHISVAVTGIEAAYIAEKTGKELVNIKTINHLEDKISKYVDKPCCFLMENKCSIYEYRPLKCRSFFTLDHPKYCQKNNVEHYIFTTESNKYLSFLYSQFVDISNKHFGNHNIDIREWFK